MTVEAVHVDASDGWASLAVPQMSGVSYIQPADAAGCGSTAIGDIWWPPSEMALPAVMCERIVTFAEEHGGMLGHEDLRPGAPSTREGVTACVLAVEREPGTSRRLPLDEMVGRRLDDDLVEAVVSRIRAANQLWWTFELDTFSLVAKRYETGGRHLAHADWRPDPVSQSRKLAASLQLSDQADYTGGRLLLRRSAGPDFCGYPVPQDRGTLAVFPSWTMHEVEPVTSGERWVLLVNGWGPRLR